MSVIGKYIATALLCISCFGVNGQTARFEALEDLQRAEKRIVLVLIQTSWCKYCHSMKHSILNNPQISKLINRKFYFVVLDGEEKQAIKFAGRIFRFKPTGQNTGVHELAFELGNINGQVSYPAICFLNSRNEIVYQNSGYLEPASLLNVLKAVTN